MIRPSYEEYKVIPAPIKDMAREVGMEVSRVAEVLPEAMQDMIRTWHTGGEDKKLDGMLESAWLSIFRYEYIDVADDVTPMYLKGPAGQGKTTVFRVAAQTIAQHMGVNIYIDPDYNQHVEPYDIVMAEPQLGGAISNTVLQGVPNIENGVTFYNPPSRIAKMTKQKLSVFLLDDLDNANEAIKNSAMPVVLSKRLNDINLKDSCYVCVTGNLGAIDGTNTSKDSAALLNRAAVRLACDTLGDWLERGEKRYDDQYGMAFIDNFLMDNPTLFYPAKQKKDRGQRATSRSWDNLTSKIRNYLAEFDAQVNAGVTPAPLMPKLEKTIPSYIGKESSEKLVTYYSDMLTLARPAALEMMEKGDLTDSMREKLTATLQSRSTESESVARGYLRQVKNMVIVNIKQAMTLPANTKEEQLRISKIVATQFDKYTRACFTSGLVKANKVNMIAMTTYDLLASLVDHANQMESASILNFGRVTEKGEYIPSEIFTRLLTNQVEKISAEHRYSEAMINISQEPDKTKTAYETAFVDAITVTTQAATLNEERKQAMAASPQ